MKEWRLEKYLRCLSCAGRRGEGQARLVFKGEWIANQKGQLLGMIGRQGWDRSSIVHQLMGAGLCFYSRSVSNKVGYATDVLLAGQ